MYLTTVLLSLTGVFSFLMGVLKHGGVGRYFQVMGC